MAMKQCRECRAPVSNNADRCPQCGIRKPVKKTSLFAWILVGIIGTAVLPSLLERKPPIEAAPEKTSPESPLAATWKAQREARLATQTAALAKDRPKIVAKIKQLIASGHFDDAVVEVARFDLVQDRELSTLQVQAQTALSKSQTALSKAQRKKEGVSLGMTTQQVLESSWGRPRRVSKTTTLAGNTEMWFYGEYSERGSLYFVEGLLALINN